MRVRRFIAAALILFLWSSPSLAQTCSFSMTDIDFGNVSLSGGQFQSTTGTLTATCSGTPGQSVRVCANFNAGSGGVHASGDPRYMIQGANRLGYNIFKSNGVGQVWGSYTWSASPRPPALSLTLGANGTGTLSETVYARIYNGQAATGTGTFLSTFSGNQTQIDYGYGASFNCGATLSPRVQSAPFVVRTTNNSSCTVATTMLNFGSKQNLSAVTDATNTISVTCTAGTVYSVGLSGGTSGAVDPTQRRMTNSATTGFVSYGIYRDAARTQPWGSTIGSNTASATGSGLAQSFVGYGRVPVQATPPALTYTDTIVVTVTY